MKEGRKEGIENFYKTIWANIEQYKQIDTIIEGKEGSIIDIEHFEKVWPNLNIKDYINLTIYRNNCIYSILKEKKENLTKKERQETLDTMKKKFMKRIQDIYQVTQQHSLTYYDIRINHNGTLDGKRASGNEIETGSHSFDSRQQISEEIDKKLQKRKYNKKRNNKNKTNKTK